MVLHARLVLLSMFALSATPCLAETMIWRSSVGNGSVQSAEIEDLYVRLYEKGELTTTPFTDPVGRDVQTILRETKRFAGTDFPIGVNSVLCKINRAVCKINEAGEPIWSNQAWSTINLPSIFFHEYTAFVPTRKEAGQEVKDLQAENPATCRDLSFDCETGIQKFNKMNQKVLDPDSEGTIIFPKRGYEAIVELLEHPEGSSDQQRKSVGKTSGFSLPSFENRLVPKTRFGFEGSYSNEPLYYEQKQLFRLINFDFAQLPDFDTVNSRFRSPTKIEVLDSWFDTDHCDMPEVTVLYRKEAPILGRKLMTCGEPLTAGQWSQALDHATHVIGVISAQVNGKAGGGLDPFAAIYYRQIPLESFSYANTRVQLTKDILGDFVTSEPSIFNMSWGYQTTGGKADPIKSMIKSTLQGSLFVVAAGNDKLDFDAGDCTAMPACLSDLPNVVTVIGLNRNETNPGRWMTATEGSNVSPQFNLGAIAENVVSTSGLNSYAAMSGTSQAAPQVTAAAAYIYSAYDALFPANGPLRPNMVKNRLIYTTDLFSPLFNFSVGGRLNFQRALDIAFDNVAFSDASGDKSIRGNLDASDSDENPVVCKKTPRRDAILIPLAELKRLYYYKDVGKFVVFYTVPIDGNYKLNRVVDCELKNPAQILHFTVGATTIDIPVGAIRDFTSKI
ncbi:S8 family serine peptidase [Rhizobium ruizarguesonis]